MIAIAFKDGDLAVVVHLMDSTEQVYTKQIFEKYGAKRIDLGGKYWAVKHPAHIPGCQKHIEVGLKNNLLFSLNIDGTAHDNSHGIRIPNKVMDAIPKFFPDWKLPKNGLIEALECKDTGTLSLIKEYKKKNTIEEAMLLVIDITNETDSLEDKQTKIINDILKPSY